MRKLLTGLCLAAAFTSVSSAVLAADSGFYILGGAGQDTSSNSSDQTLLNNALTSAGGTGFTSTMNQPTVSNLMAGYKINKNFAVEGGYIRSANETYTAAGGNLAGPVNATAKVDGWDLTAVGIWPVVDQFSLLGKLGVADAHISGSVSGPGGSVSASGSKTDFTYGIGAQYDFTSAVFGRLDFDSYNIGNSTYSSRTTVWTVNIGYMF